MGECPPHMSRLDAIDWRRNRGLVFRAMNDRAAKKAIGSRASNPASYPVSQLPLITQEQLNEEHLISSHSETPFPESYEPYVDNSCSNEWNSR